VRHKVLISVRNDSQDGFKKRKSRNGREPVFTYLDDCPISARNYLQEQIRRLAAPHTADAPDWDFETLRDTSGNSIPNPNQFFVFGLTDADLGGSKLVPQKIKGFDE
jgi:hypothetical protein